MAIVTPFERVCQTLYHCMQQGIHFRGSQICITHSPLGKLHCQKDRLRCRRNRRGHWLIAVTFSVILVFLDWSWMDKIDVCVCIQKHFRSIKRGNISHPTKDNCYELLIEMFCVGEMKALCRNRVSMMLLSLGCSIGWQTLQRTWKTPCHCRPKTGFQGWPAEKSTHHRFCVDFLCTFCHD